MTDVDTPGRPVRLQWLRWAVGAWCALTILAAVAILGQHQYLADALIKANAKADKPKLNYTGQIVDTDVTRIMRYDLVQAILISVILTMVTFAVLRGRNWARWLLLGMATVLPVIVPVLGIGIIVQLLTGLLSSFPPLYRALEVLAGLAAMGVVFILFLPEVRTYFGGVRAEEKAERAQLYRRPDGAPRPAGPLGLLLGRRTARRPAPSTPSAPLGRPAERSGPKPPLSTLVPPSADSAAGSGADVPAAADAGLPPVKRSRRAAPKSREQ